MKRPNHVTTALLLIFGTSIAIAMFFFVAFYIADSFEDNRGFFCFNIGLLVLFVMAGIWMIKTKRI